MKKKIIIIVVTVLVIAGILLAILLPIFKKNSNELKNKYTIFVSVFKGGHGVGWAQKAAEDFNKINDVYTVEIVPDLNGGADVIADVASGSPSASLYFTCDIQFQQAIYQGLFEDLSSVLDSHVDGADKPTVRAKMNETELWMQAASKNGEGCYMLPYADSFMGLTYDHDLFVEKQWLQFADSGSTAALDAQGITYKTVGKRLQFVSDDSETKYIENDFILTAGKDDKFGTYDDGQPENIAEWDAMLDKICVRDGERAFIWSGKNTPYVDDVFTGLFAQYAGKEAFDTYFNFDSKGNEIAMRDGKSKAITVENGNSVYSMKGIKESFEFVNTYLNNSAHTDNPSLVDYVHPASRMPETSNFDAQNFFLLGYRDEPSNPQAAMLVDGVWWENEAKEMFKTFTDSNEGERGYGMRDYRYMLYPAMDGQKGIDGKGNGSVFAVRESSGVLVPKVKDTEKMNKAKEFLAFTMKDEYLRLYTKISGAMRPYKYDMEAADFKEMTKFKKTLYDIYNDKENIMLVRPMLNMTASPMCFATNKTISKFPINVGGADLPVPITALQRYSVEILTNSIADFYTNARWKEYLDIAKEAGFYK